MAMPTVSFIGERITTTKTPKISPNLFETIQRAYQLVAKRSAELCGVELSPAQVQAVTWVTYRRLIHGIQLALTVTN
jgi:hypothetical protein